MEDAWKNNSDIVDRVLAAVEDGTVEPYNLIIACLKFMGSDQVHAMLKANEINLEEESDD